MNGTLDKFIDGVTQAAVLIVVVAIIAVIVSNGSRTAEVIQAGANALTRLLAVIVNPVPVGTTTTQEPTR